MLSVLLETFCKKHSLIMCREISVFLLLPALTNVADGCQKPVALQTLQDGLNGGLRAAEGGLRAGVFMGSNLIICH